MRVFKDVQLVEQLGSGMERIMSEIKIDFKRFYNLKFKTTLL